MTIRSLCAPIVLILLASGQAHAGMLYLALGDSNGFGNDESRPASMMPNFGDQGYVRPFADFLGTLNGGVRPQVTNLSIPGELSSSFLTGMPPTDWPNRAWERNLNYPTATTSQNSLLVAALDAAHAAGNSVYVTLNFGGNDFSYLTASAAWQGADSTQQQALFSQLLTQVASNYATVMTEVKSHAPGAHILLPNFFDNTLPSDPAYAFNELPILTANQILQQQLAPAFGATYVDFYSVIHGNVSAFTNSTGDRHLNQAGYNAVALALDAAAVPEPPSCVMLGIGLTGLAGFVWRRRVVAHQAKNEGVESAQTTRFSGIYPAV